MRGIFSSRLLPALFAAIGVAAGMGMFAESKAERVGTEMADRKFGVPSLDAVLPGRIESATFALG